MVAFRINDGSSSSYTLSDKYVLNTFDETEVTDLIS